MRKFLGTRLGVILVTAVIAVLAISVAAQAALNLNKPLPATANIKSATANLIFGADPVFNTVITSVGFGDVEQGTTKSVTVYLKNMGSYTLNSLAATVSGLDPAAASITVGTFTSTTLAPSGTTSVVLTLVPVDNGPTGPVSPTVTFSATN